ncbi:hypothetical protein KFE94_03990 [bacterium SCSIO 12643]|nr:hypothetical protein KFE94_03990 [bacterium SCSIO 12643]
MNKYTNVTLGLLIAFIIIMNGLFAPGNIISWDVYGYYLYLPLQFIFHDLGMADDVRIFDLMEQYKSSATFYQAMKMPEGNYVMKYSMGMAILYAPFFFLGWLSALLLNYPIDGFSLPFQYALHFGSILYSLIGIWFASKVLNHFFNSKISALILALIVFGTNYMVHITMYGQNAMSHNYLFTGYALVLWFTIKWHERFEWKYALGLSVVMGLMILSRPTEIVVLALPVLWGVFNWQSFLVKLQILLKHKYQVLMLVMILMLFGSFQFVYWKIYAGKFLYNSYGGNAGEGLELLRPFTKQFLFSFRKGWLIYTPLMIFATVGFYAIYRKNREIFLAVIVFFLFNLYLVSSWSNWWYAQSFSQRPMVSSYLVMALGLGYFIVWLSEQKKYIQFTLGGVIVLIVGLNIFQTIQFHKGVIHGDRMTRDYYFASFGKLNVTEEDRKLLLIDRNYTGTDAFTNEEEYEGTLLKEHDFNDGDDSLSYSGCCSYRLTSRIIYSPVIEKAFKDITRDDYVWFKVSVYVFIETQDVVEDFSLVVHFDHKGYAYNYKTIESKNLDLKKGEWNKIEFDYLSPEVRNGNDLFRTFVWYRGNHSLLIDNMKVEVFEKRD